MLDPVMVGGVHLMLGGAHRRDTLQLVGLSLLLLDLIPLERGRVGWDGMGWCEGGVAGRGWGVVGRGRVKQSCEG